MPVCFCMNLFFWLSVGLSICLSLYLFVCLSVCIRINLFSCLWTVSFWILYMLSTFSSWPQPLSSSSSFSITPTVYKHWKMWTPPPSHHHTCPQNNNKIWAGEGMVFASLTNGLPKYAKRHLASVGEVIGRCLQLCYFGKTSERPRSAYGLFWAHRYHLEVNLTEMSFVTAAKMSSVTRWGKH